VGPAYEGVALLLTCTNGWCKQITELPTVFCAAHRGTRSGEWAAVMAKTRSEAVACKTPEEKKTHEVDLRATVHGTLTHKPQLPVPAVPKTTRVYSLALMTQWLLLHCVRQPPVATAERRYCGATASFLRCSINTCSDTSSVKMKASASPLAPVSAAWWLTLGLSLARRKRACDACDPYWSHSM